jgi:hypothetical protein
MESYLPAPSTTTPTSDFVQSDDDCCLPRCGTITGSRPGMNACHLTTSGFFVTDT